MHKLMSGKELAKFILSKNFDEEYSFATTYPEDVSEEELNPIVYEIQTLNKIGLSFKHIKR